MGLKTIHIDQFCAGFSPGDAISNEAINLRNFLRKCGYKSDIYSEQFKENENVKYYGRYHGNKNSIIIYHHSFYTEILHELRKWSARKILIFHNVTPPYYVRQYNRKLAKTLFQAKNELRKIRKEFHEVAADSIFNATVLKNLGFNNVTVLPVPVEFRELDADFSFSESRLNFIRDGKLNVLFVGRIFPNKCHQDILKAFYFFQKLRPESRLLMVGPFHPGVRGYTAELNILKRELGLCEKTFFTDMLSDQEVVECYKNSNIFLSMSEHEGFFVPLLESMHYNLPILAYGSTVIPETLGNSGVIFYKKDFVRIAEMMVEIIENSELRNSIISRQSNRIQEFKSETSFSILLDLIKKIEK